MPKPKKPKRPKPTSKSQPLAVKPSQLLKRTVGVYEIGGKKFRATHFDIVPKSQAAQALAALAAMESALQLGGVIVIHRSYDQRRDETSYIVQHVGGNELDEVGGGLSILAAVNSCLESKGGGQ